MFNFFEQNQSLKNLLKLILLIILTLISSFIILLKFHEKSRKYFFAHSYTFDFKFHDIFDDFKDKVKENYIFESNGPLVNFYSPGFLILINL